MQCFRNSTLYLLFVHHHIFSAVSFNVFALVQALIFYFPFLSCVFVVLLWFCVSGVFWLFFLEGGGGNFVLVWGIFGVPPPLSGYHIFSGSQLLHAPNTEVVLPIPGG